MPAHRKGVEVRQNVCIRLEPSEKDLLVQHFGGVQAAVDSVLISIYKKMTETKVGTMKKITGDEYFGALEYLAESNPKSLEYLYLRTINVLNEGDKYVGEFYRDEDSLYGKAQDNGDFLHIADIDWDRVDRSL